MFVVALSLWGSFYQEHNCGNHLNRVKLNLILRTVHSILGVLSGKFANQSDNLSKFAAKNYELRLFTYEDSKLKLENVGNFT